MGLSKIHKIPCCRSVRKVKICRPESFDFLCLCSDQMSQRSQVSRVALLCQNMFQNQKVAHWVSDSVSQWQGHLLSCPQTLSGQQKICNGIIMMVILMTKMAKNIQVKIEWSLSISGQDGEDKDEDVIMALGKHDMWEKFQAGEPPAPSLGTAC